MGAEGYGLLKYSVCSKWYRDRGQVRHSSYYDTGSSFFLLDNILKPTFTVGWPHSTFLLHTSSPLILHPAPHPMHARVLPPSSYGLGPREVYHLLQHGYNLMRAGQGTGMPALFSACLPAGLQGRPLACLHPFLPACLLGCMAGHTASRCASSHTPYVAFSQLPPLPHSPGCTSAVHSLP